MVVSILFGLSYLVAYVVPFINHFSIVIRLGLLIVHFFIQLYCLYSQLSPLLSEKTVAYSSLPE